MADPQPCRPALAYFEVAAILPKEFFTTPPPSAGSRLTVVGMDGVPTVWDMGPLTARYVERILSKRRGLSCSIESYETKPAGFDAG